MVDKGEPKVVRFRVPEPVKIIEPHIRIEVEDLRLIVDPSSTEVEQFGKTPLPSFPALRGLQEVCEAAKDYHEATGSRVILDALQEALEFASRLPPPTREAKSESKTPMRVGHTCGVLGACDCE